MSTRERALLLPLALLLALPARAERPVLAPGPEDLDRAIADLELRLENAEAIGVAAARVQNALAEGLAAGGTICAEEGLTSLATRSAMLGRAHRDAAQAASTQALRVRELRAAPTLVPLLAAGQANDGAQALARSDEQVGLQRELKAWHERDAAPALKRCPTPLTPAPGLPAPLAHQRDLTAAVIVVEGAVFCPGALPAGVQVGPVGCATLPEDGCSCEAHRLLPGEVLGPAPPEPEPPPAQDAPAAP